MISKPAWTKMYETNLNNVLFRKNNNNEYTVVYYILRVCCMHNIGIPRSALIQFHNEPYLIRGL